MSKEYNWMGFGKCMYLRNQHFFQDIYIFVTLGKCSSTVKCNNLFFSVMGYFFIKKIHKDRKIITH